LVAAFIALPSSAKAYSWWSGWDSYAECTDYYAKNPPSMEGISRTLDQEVGYLCAGIRAKEAQKRREQEAMFRMIVLSCQASSVTYAQTAACVALVTGQ
jgi:hypothetical protein